MVSHCACPGTLTRDVRDRRDERDAWLVYLVYLVSLVCLVKPPLRVSNEGLLRPRVARALLILYISLWESGRGCPLLRASSDHRLLVSLSWNGTRAGPTAAVERAHSDRARSGSKGSARVSFHPFHRARSASKKGTWPLFPIPPSSLVLPPRAAWSILDCARQTSTSSSPHLPLGEWPRLPFTARIGRALFHRARSASKKGTWLPPASPLDPSF